MTKICLIAGNSEEAYRFAKSQGLEKEQWFYPHTERDLLFQNNFHVLIVGTAGQNIPSNIFEKIYNLALERGKVGRI